MINATSASATALTQNPSARLPAAMNRPASAGARMRRKLYWAELSATALPIDGSVDDRRDDRLGRGELDREREAGEERQDQHVPVLDQAGRRQDGEDEGEHGGRAVGDHEQPAPVHAIGEHAGEHREEERRAGRPRRPRGRAAPASW